MSIYVKNGLKTLQTNFSSQQNIENVSQWQSLALRMLSSSLNTGHLRLMRSIRLARALRSMRVLRLFRYVTALRTLVLSIMSTMGSLFWTLALLIILFYSFGLVVTQLVVDHCRFITMDSGVGSLPTCPQLLDKYWASVSESALANDTLATSSFTDLCY